MNGNRKDKVLGKVQLDLSKFMMTDNDLFNIDIISDQKDAFIQGRISINEQVHLSDEQIADDIETQVSSTIGESNKDLD